MHRLGNGLYSLRASATPEATAVDLFCGAGGLSLGLRASGFDVLLGVDQNQAAAETYGRAFGSRGVLQADLARMSPRSLARQAGISRGELDLLAAGPPCQGLSILGRRRLSDSRNALFLDVFKFAEYVRPRYLLIENVPGLATLEGGRFVRSVVGALKSLSYKYVVAELLAAQYGVPQMRWRLVLLAARRDQRLPDLPVPSHGKHAVGYFVPNRRIVFEDHEGFLTTEDAIRDLPPIAAGGEGRCYGAVPVTPYQRAMRDGADELHNHYAPRLNALNIRRINALSPGQDWRDLPVSLLPDSMKRALRKDHTRRFRRMRWETTPRAIVTRFRDPKTGEYIHPEQPRTISIREAARIQSFPDAFRFLGSRSEQYDLVGNAVPPLLGKAIGNSVLAAKRREDAEPHDVPTRYGIIDVGFSA